VVNQWVRLQAGAFQAYGGSVYVFGTCSLDDPTPDDSTADAITLNSNDDGSITVGDASGDSSVGTYARTFASPATTYVRSHGGDDSVDASGMTGAQADCALVVLDGSGYDTVTGGTCATDVVAGGGGFSFSGPAEGDAFIFAGDSPLGPSGITMTTTGGQLIDLTLDFSQLGEPINLDLGQSAQQTLNGLLNLTVSLGDNACAVYGTPYDDTIASGPEREIVYNGGGIEPMAVGPRYVVDSIYGDGGNDTLVANGPANLNNSGGDTTFIVNGPYDVWISGADGFNTLVANDAAGNPTMDGVNAVWDDSHSVVAWWYDGAVQAVEIGGAYTFLGGGSSATPVSENIPDGSNLTVAGGTQLDLGDGTVNLGSLTVTGGSTIFAGSITAASYAIQGGTIYADLGDPAGAAASLTVGGNVTLVGQNTYTGGTTVQAGTLVFSSPSAAPSSGILTVNSGGMVVLGALGGAAAGASTATAIRTAPASVASAAGTSVRTATPASDAAATLAAEMSISSADTLPRSVNSSPRTAISAVAAAGPSVSEVVSLPASQEGPRCVPLPVGAARLPFDRIEETAVANVKAGGSALFTTAEQTHALDVALQSRQVGPTRIGTLHDLGFAHDRSRHYPARKHETPEYLADAALVLVVL
jgi:autotransporter-associated beta strand protein